MKDLWRNVACPFLPQVERRIDPWLTRRHGVRKGAEFYRDALAYAQSQWLSGKPAQAILQLNKAWMAELDGGERELADFPSPYRALVWLLGRSRQGREGFMGNPVRHFQHLASRMSGPRAEVRAWRAWVCFHLAERVLAGEEFARDGVQIAREGLWIPGWTRAQREVRLQGWKGEAREMSAAWEEAGASGKFP